ncbi:cholesterol esterase [Streptomyces albireticuli]|uniref:Cholesterol esterase n=1 Tax=Streptomyces albireticuli TaxID=1940 RepID=A0A1Z2L7Q5_9ACTN|nr:cholesterol esterase [Streptomyces albireticuli]
MTGRVKWRKFALLAVPGFAATAALAVALAQGALAASFAVSGQQFKISADSLEGTGFAQYGGVDVNAHDDLIPVAVTSIKRAELTKLCQSVVMRLPILGAVSLNLHAGGGGKPVQATDLFLDATQMSGDAEFTNIEIGRDASTLDKGPDGAQGMTDVFAQQADKVQMTKVRQTAWATNAGSFRLNGLDMKVLKGERECF